MDGPRLSIVIAVNDYVPDADAWLRALLADTGTGDELLIVDGRETGDYTDAVRRVPPSVRCDVEPRYLRIGRTCRAAALNRAVAETTAEIVLFLGDDFIPRPGLVRAHRTYHAAHPDPTAVAVGGGTLPPELRNRFATWLERSGQLYGVRYGGDERMPDDFFYVANASVKRAFLESVGPFEEAFPHPGWDDYELGLRLRAAGMTAEFLDDAWATHHHRITLEDRCQTMRESAESARVFEALRPGPYAWEPTMAVPPWRHRLGAVYRYARYMVRRDPADLGRFYRRVLDGVFCAAYRASAPR